MGDERVSQWDRCGKARNGTDEVSVLPDYFLLTTLYLNKHTRSNKCTYTLLHLLLEYISSSTQYIAKHKCDAGLVYARNE